MRRIRAVATIGLLLTTIMAVGSAAPAYAVPTKADFAAQARDAGLTAAQAASLQKRVNAYLVRTGGKQVAANKIDLDGKGLLLLALPGEARAREIGTPVALASTPCSERWFCAYSQQQYAGDLVEYYYCEYKLSMPFPALGSYKNRQTAGTSAHFYDGNGAYMYDSLAAPNSSTPFNWAWVWWVKPCGSV